MGNYSGCISKEEREVQLNENCLNYAFRYADGKPNIELNEILSMATKIKNHIVGDVGTEITFSQGTGIAKIGKCAIEKRPEFTDEEGVSGIEITFSQGSGTKTGQVKIAKHPEFTDEKGEDLEKGPHRGTLEDQIKFKKVKTSKKSPKSK